MRLLIRAALTGLFCIAVVGGMVYWLTRPAVATRRTIPPTAGEAARTADDQARAPVFDIILERFEDGGFSTVSPFMARRSAIPARSRRGREAIRGRGRRAITALRAQYDALPLDAPALKRIGLQKSIGLAYMYEGKFIEAASWLEKALDGGKAADVPAAIRTELMALLGICGLRRGGTENCLECIGPSSCLFPLAPEAVHRNPEGSRAAVRWFTAYLKEQPSDLRVIWLLNIASMTLGEYPDKVPRNARIPVAPFQSKLDAGRFTNVAAKAGLGARGPNLAGGSIFDDFNGDGLPDLFTTSLDADLGASLFVNRGDGTFEDRSASAGLSDQVYALNVARADFDNDGHPDVVLLRGGWEAPMPLSLLRNRGDGTFEDVTKAAGLGQPITTESAAWGDYDNDGLVDLFVCGEFVRPGEDPKTAKGDPQNHCRLYRNQGDGTFRDVAAQAGVTNDRCAKGVAWGDYDGDGRLDLFVSNMGQECRLYHNEGDGTFRDVAPKLGVTGGLMSFACWFWDFDNDGLLDLYVNDYRTSTAEAIASAMGVKVEGMSRPRLYRNLGPAGFRDVSQEVGLDRAMAPMGANFGDIDNDGYLDIYLGTGHMSYSGLEPNLMFKNVEGRRFEDITTSSGTGHLQKGHGVSFADYDGDGDLDLFVELGGGIPGDQGYNALFRNPGHGRHWLKVKLVGTKTNRSALVEKIRVTLHNPNRSIHRTIGNNGSFGGNSLVETIGLLDAKTVAELTVTWPTSGTTQTFHDPRRRSDDHDDHRTRGPTRHPTPQTRVPLRRQTARTTHATRSKAGSPTPVMNPPGRSGRGRRRHFRRHDRQY